MTGAHNSTHLDTVGENAAKVVLNWGLREERDWLIHDGPGLGRPVRIITITSAVADVITLDADPLADIGVLGAPDHVTGVWTGGRQVKIPGVP